MNEWAPDYLNDPAMGAPAQPDPAKQNNFLDYLSQVASFSNGGRGNSFGGGDGQRVQTSPTPHGNSAAQSAAVGAMMGKGATTGIRSL